MGKVKVNGENDITIVLAGNPNVGKSTVFNCLTGMHQHTGNWAGKTVSNARGRWKVGEREITLIDAPGCYSLVASSAEEEVARDCICDPSCKGVIVVCDGTCLERNFILLLQILSHRKDVVLCINLMDRVRKEGLKIDTKRLEKLLGIKVITTESSEKKEMKRVLEGAAEFLIQEPRKLKTLGYVPELLESPEDTAKKAEEIAGKVTGYKVRGNSKGQQESVTLKVDRFLTNPFTGFPIMALMMLAIFWITMEGANYPSQMLGKILFSLEEPMYNGLLAMGLGEKVCNMVACGMYRVLAWVVSVMLPPMAIFFPLFTLLEDWGFLPRIAFNLDRCFKCCGACGKQALTMCMGLGCNASAVVGCRIIDSKRERLLAMITNSLVPCNGRFPILIAIVTMFFASQGGWQGALCITGVIMAGIGATFVLTRILSHTFLKGVPSSFTLELPAYRKPEIGKVIVRSVFDRTIFVLGRAVAVAAPAGLIIWILANTSVDGVSLIDQLAGFLEPFGRFIGLDGVILTAFILGIPANEIVLPIAMMIYMSQGNLAEVTDLTFFKELLVENGWTALTALNMMIFSLMHWPCATTLISIKKESGSLRWTILSFLAPLVLGVAICAVTATVYRIIL